MPTTRSSARLATTTAGNNSVVPSRTDTKPKKRAAEGSPSKPEGKKRTRKAANSVSASQTPLPAATQQAGMPTELEDTDALVPAELTFSFEEAKQHLISADRRFEDIFDKLSCKPFENLEQFHPFRALATSILGQQISWLAARSIIHKFKRMYDQTLPEKPGEESAGSFPSPAQVAATDLAVLRTAGLSQRKAEYIQDLAKRFADGRLSTQKILSANDEELAEMLIEVRGIGRASDNLDVEVARAANGGMITVDMFAIFSLRRPDILPVGDLGVQRGIARWALALHSESPADGFSLSPQKVAQSATKKSEEKTSRAVEGNESDDDAEEGDLPMLGETNTRDNSGPSQSTREKDVDMLGGLPPPFTPSITKTLRKPAGAEVHPLPKTLTIADLKARISGKKKIKGALLTPQEMEDLTETWKPYRSIGVYYMWSLAAAE